MKQLTSPVAGRVPADWRGREYHLRDPRDPFATGGHQGASETGPGGGEPADVGRDDVVLIYDDCTDEQINSKAAKRCLDQAKKDPDHDYYVRCVRNKMGCCYDYVGNDRKKHRECKNLTP